MALIIFIFGLAACFFVYTWCEFVDSVSYKNMWKTIVNGISVILMIIFTGLLAGGLKEVKCEKCDKEYLATSKIHYCYECGSELIVED